MHFTYRMLPRIWNIETATICCGGINNVFHTSVLTSFMIIHIIKVSIDTKEEEDIERRSQKN